MVKFIIAVRLAVDDIIGKELLNRDVETILFTEQRASFKNGSVPIVHQKNKSSVGGDSPFAVKLWPDKTVRTAGGDDPKEIVNE